MTPAPKTPKANRKSRKGFVHVYTGNGKGKTTAALGLALRAAGYGLKVYIIQFMKGCVTYGELRSSKHIPNFTIKQFGRPDFVNKDNPAKIDIALAQKGLKHAEKILKNGKRDIVILDEINVAIEWNLIKLDDAIRLIKGKPQNVELILTGRYAPQKIIDMADLVTEMREIKHYYRKGIISREGIDH
ncbi:MAG: cob(I)yrinic acid a,c-diamide adenosyltransferase [Thermoplasmata archaeon]